MHLQTILDTTKRKCSWPITKGIFKKRKLEGGHRKKENFDHQYTEMNFSKWWWRMEKEGQPGASGMENKKKSFSGIAKKPGPCDFKLAYISLWWRRMEGEGLKESQENPMRERMILYLKAGKKDELKKNVNTQMKMYMKHKQPDI